VSELYIPTIGLTANAQGGTEPYQYKFYFKMGDYSSTIQEFATNSSVSFVPNNAGFYSLFVEIKDANGKNVSSTIENYQIVEKGVTLAACSYRTHVQNVGWQSWKTNGGMSGTSGKGLRLEGIEIAISEKINDLGIEYSTHVENIGWQDYVKNGEISGTSGKGLRLEAIKISLTGTEADKYDIYYQVHAQNIGWLDWAKNGEESRTAGFGYRLEGMKIIVVPKGGAAPGDTARPFRVLNVTKGLFSKKISEEESTKSMRNLEMSIDDQIESLKKLKELLDCGIITQEVFDAKKRQIMGD
jgi:uncharacterized protein YjdB